MEPSEVLGVPRCAEENLGAGRGGGEHGIDHVAGPSHCVLPEGEAQHKKGEEKLQAQAPRHGAPTDVFAIG